MLLSVDNRNEKRLVVGSVTFDVKNYNERADANIILCKNQVGRER